MGARAGSCTKKCVNPKYPVLHLGISVLNVCLSQRLSPNISVTPWATTLQCRAPKISCLELWTPMTESLRVFSHGQPCRFSASHLGHGRRMSLWMAAQERAVEFMHPRIPVRGTFVQHSWEFCPSRSGELMHIIHLPVCESSQAALCGRISRMNPPYTPPFQICFS